MKCTEFKSAVHDLAKGHVPESQVSQVEGETQGHAATCPECCGFMDVALELTCKDLVEFLNEYIDGDLLPERRDVFERHLAICADCTNYLDTYRKTMTMAVSAMLPGQGLSLPGLPEDLVRAILAARK